MTEQTPAVVTIRQIATSLRKRWWLAAVPCAASMLLSLTYALVRPDTWEAAQTLHLRDEAQGKQDQRNGDFSDADSMKSAQETILEVAKNQQVISAALVELGPPADRSAAGEFPSGEEVEDLRKSMRLSPPQGAELGRTEILYLAVKDHSRQRAIALTTAVCNQLEDRLKQLRNNKAQSIIAELDKTRRLSQTDLDAATALLEKMETQVGPDLGELRILNESGAGDSNLRSGLNQIKGELRQAETLRNTNVELLKFLRAARQDPGELVAAPNRLLESQPALKRLKEGLIDAQLRTAEVSANRTLAHPKVQAAQMAEQLVQRDLHKELDTAIRGLDADLRVNESQIAALETQAAEITNRLDKLAGLRARYANLVADVKQRSESLERSKKDLADARASQAAATSVSLLTRLDLPQTGNYPVGPGRTTIVLGGTAGGFLLGIGLIFLVTPLGGVRGRRWSDYLGFGRRASDLKRSADSLPTGLRAADGGSRATDRAGANPRAADGVLPEAAAIPSASLSAVPSTAAETAPAQAEPIFAPLLECVAELVDAPRNCEVIDAVSAHLVAKAHALESNSAGVYLATPTMLEMLYYSAQGQQTQTEKPNQVSTEQLQPVQVARPARSHGAPLSLAQSLSRLAARN